MSKAKEVLNLFESDLAASYIARQGAFRKDAVQKLIDNNNWDGDKLASLVKSKGKELVDLILVALVGNDKAKKVAIKKIDSLLK